jgi:hypothetical protein
MPAQFLIFDFAAIFVRMLSTDGDPKVSGYLAMARQSDHRSASMKPPNVQSPFAQ